MGDFSFDKLTGNFFQNVMYIILKKKNRVASVITWCCATYKEDPNKKGAKDWVMGKCKNNVLGYIFGYWARHFAQARAGIALDSRGASDEIKDADAKTVIEFLT